MRRIGKDQEKSKRGLNMKTIPFSYQMECVKEIEDFDCRSLVALDMGLGKSLISLIVAQRNNLFPMIVVCPASLKWNWQAECTKHLGIRSRILEGTKPPPVHGFRWIPPITIVNYDILHHWFNHLIDLDPKLIVLDEVHYCADVRTKRTKTVNSLCKRMENILGLSGTPLVNRPIEMFTILNILRPDVFPSRWKYAFRYCDGKKGYYGWDFKGASNISELHSKLTEHLMVRRLKIDVLKDLPSKQRIVLPMPITNAKEYGEAQRDFIGWLRKTAPEKVTRARKAQSLTKLSHLKRLAAAGKMKASMEWVDSFLSESDGKLLLFAVHKSIIKELKDRYKRICVVIDGLVTGKDRQLSVEKFQKNKTIRILIGNIKAAGVGLNLTAANTVAFAELAWHPGAHVQCEDRAWRIGTTQSVTVYYLVGYGTLESDLVELIQTKAQVLNAVLDDGQGEDLDIFDQLTKKMMEKNNDRSSRKVSRIT